MWTFRKKALFAFYRMFASWLPRSQRSKFAKKARLFWARRIASVGNNVNIERNCFFTPDLRIGNNSGIGVNCEIYGPVSIGDNVLMGPEVIIYTNGHEYSNPDLPIGEQGLTKDKPVIIGDDCWICRRVMIMPGVEIGKGCVIAAGSVVTKNIPPFCVAGGVPAKIIKMRVKDENTTNNT